MRKIYTIIILSSLFLSVKAGGVFNSTGVTSDFSTSTSWTLVSGADTDGIPDSDDDVTILSGHTISLSANSNVKTLVINNGGTFTTNNKYLNMYGTAFTNSGTVSGNLYFTWTSGSAATITSSAQQIKVTVLVMNGTTINIPSGTKIIFTSIYIRNGSTLNNSGTFTTSGLLTQNTSGNTLNNLNGGSVTIFQNASSNLTINNNTTSMFILGTPVSSVPNCTYSNLTILANGGTKTVSANLTITGNLINNSNTTLNLSSKNLTVSGNLTNTGTISNVASLTLDGSSNQTLSSNSAISATSITASNTNTVIFSGSTYSISGSNSFSGNVTVNSGATLNLNSNTFNLAGNLSNSGTISNLSDANFNGSSSQSISSSQSLTFNNLTTSNSAGVTITSGNHLISNSLKVTSGSLNVGSSLMTLVSDGSKTAYIDVAGSGGTISGTMIIQRNITAQAANYHDLASPVSSTTMADWDDELYMSIGAPDDGSGDYTGSDGSSSGVYSVYTYDEPTSNWNAVGSGSATPINVGQGYDVYIADDATSFPGRAIDTRGTPNMSNVTVAVTNTVDGYNLLGNPFACHLDWSAVVAANPTLLSSTIQTLQSGNYADIADPSDVPPGQGFFAVATGAGNITIPTSAGLTLTGSSMDRKPFEKNYDVKLRLSSSVNPYMHEIKIAYNDAYSKGFDNGKDLTYIKSPVKEAPYITFIDGSKKIARNYINTANNIVTMPLEIKTPISGNYIIDIEGITGSDEYDLAYIINNDTQEQFDINDGQSVTLYLDNNGTHNNYSVVLMKSNANITNAFASEQSVAIFATSENINIKGTLSDLSESTIEVYNLMGQLVIKSSGIINNNNPILIPTTDLKSDIYVVKVISPNNEQFTKKVVITK